MAAAEGDAKKSLENFIHKSLKYEQTECIRRIVCLEEDVLAVLPTGFGNGVIYHLIPKVRMKKLHPSGGFKTSVVVVSPLEYTRKQQRRIVESLLPQLENPSRSTEKLRQRTSTLFTARLNNG